MLNRPSPSIVSIIERKLVETRAELVARKAQAEVLQEIIKEFEVIDEDTAAIPEPPHGP